MKINESLEKIFEKQIEYVKESVEKGMSGSAVFITLKDTEKETSYSAGVAKIPMEIFGSLQDAIDILTSVAAKKSADGILLFLTVTIAMLAPPPPNTDVTKLLGELEVNGVKESDVIKDIDVLLCLAETKDKQLHRAFEVVNQSPWEWKDFIDKGAVVHNQISGILYEGNKEKVSRN